MNIFLSSIPSDWKSNNIGNFIRLEYGFSLPEKNRIKGPFPVYGSNGIVGFHNKSFIKAPGIIIGRKGSIGEVNYTDIDFCPIDTTYYIVNIENNNWKWLYYILSILNLKNLNAATGVPGLNRNDVHNLKIPIPTIKEQNKIATILSTVHDLIENTDHLINSYTLLKKGLMQTLLTKGIGHTEFKKTEIGKIPVEWQMKNLCEVITTIESGGRPTGGATKNSGTIPSFGGENILKNGGVDYRNIRKISLDYYKNMSMGKLNDKDILINKDGANTGKVGIYTNKYYKEGSINEHIFLIRGFKKAITQEFLYYYLLSDKGQYYIKQKIIGSAQPGINKSFTHNFPIPVPHINEQEEISKILISLDEQLSIFKEKKEKLNLSKKGLMQQLLTGKKRVRV